MLLRKSLACVCLRQPECKKKSDTFVPTDPRDCSPQICSRARVRETIKKIVRYVWWYRSKIARERIGHSFYRLGSIFWTMARARLIAKTDDDVIATGARARARTHSLDARTDRCPRNSRSEARMRTKRRRVRTSSNRVWHHASLLEVYVILLNPFSEESVRGARR